MFKFNRINREKKTVEATIKIYCRKNHGKKNEICFDCKELLDYAFKRLDKCPFQEGKTTCGKCKIHCYKPVMREKIKHVMRYSGPKMAYLHPLLALYHFIDSFRKTAAKQNF